VPPGSNRSKDRRLNNREQSSSEGEKRLLTQSGGKRGKISGSGGQSKGEFGICGGKN